MLYTYAYMQPKKHHRKNIFLFRFQFNNSEEKTAEKQLQSLTLENKKQIEKVPEKGAKRERGSNLL